ncbi:MAG: histidine phosphatase family protein, partial [Prevotella sp.]|nr:histidine phosphatase family protein [Prevotella sp.]
MKILKSFLWLALVWLTASPAMAQYERLGGIYYAYPVTQTEMAKAPAGYEPFYISHYGRHGSRWVTNDKRYIWVCRHFDDTKNLTKLGRDVRKRLAKVWKNAEGNGGKLSPLGARQHRAIAKRMYENFPQVFTPAAHLTAHSSVVGRCQESMRNFLESLESLA